MSLRPTLGGVLRLPSSLRAAFSTTTSTLAPPPPPRDSSHRHPSSTFASSASSLMHLDRPSGGYRSPGSRSSRPPATEAAKIVGDSFKRSLRAKDLRNKQYMVDNLRERKMSNEYLREMPRRWQIGDVYSPHDLSPVEMSKWRRKAEKKGDIIDLLGIRPLDMYKNFSMLAEFTKSSGQIMHADITGLRPVNQRKIAKMIRRAQGMGIYPSVHGHPEMIRHNFHGQGRQQS